MIINDLYNNKKQNISEGTEGQVVFSGTGDNGGTYEIIQSGPTDFMIHANGKHIDTYGSLQRAMSVLKNEVPGLQQGVAEGMPLGKVLSFPDLLGQVKHILDAKHGSIGWKMSKRDDDVFLFSAMNDYDVRSMLVVAKDRDGWVSATNGIVDPYGEVEMFDKQELPMTLASASEIADEAISTYHDIDLSDYADEDEQGVTEGSVTKKPQPYNDPDWIKKLPKDQLDALGGKRYSKDKKPVSEVSLGDYRKKAAVSQAGAKINKFFDRDDPAKVAAADQTIAKREQGLARADARVKPYTPPAAAPVDLEKQQRDLTAKYPNIDELVRRAELNRDPNYERADGQAYYTARDAEQNYLKLKQIQRVIQGLNESLQKKNLLEFDPVTPVGDEIRSRNSAMINPATQKPYLPSELAGYQSRRAARKATVPTPDPVAEPVGVAMPINSFQVPDVGTNPNSTKPVTAQPVPVPNTAMTTTGAPGFNASNMGRSYTAPAAASKLQTIDAPAQLSGPAPVKQLGMADPNVTDVVAKTPTAKKQPVANIAALPAPAATVTPNYSKSVAGHGNPTINPKAALSPGTNAMMPTNMMPRTAAVPPKPVVPTLTPTARNDILQALKKLGYKSKEAEAAIKQLPPNINTSDAVKQIRRGKPVTSESLTWSQNFDPGRSLYRRIKQKS